MASAIGVDIGQTRDPTALAVVEAVTRELQLRHLERLPLGTPYLRVVGHIDGIASKLPRAALVVDATGVGRPIVDLLCEAGHAPVAVSITAGKAITFDGDTWHVPKRELVRALVLALESGRLKIARRIPLADGFVRELAAFKVKVSQRGHDAYEGRGEHDDLVIATALAVWWADLLPA